MGVIAEKDREKLTKIFESLLQDVKVVVFTQEVECGFCQTTRQILEEVSGLSQKISLEVYDFVKDEALVKKYNVSRIPATILIGDRNYGIRFYGTPAGYEFTTMIQDIMMISRRDPGLSREVLDELSKVDQPVHIQVMISPTCPYCAAAVGTVHRFAMASDYITGDMVELAEFPHLAVKYNVQGVPKIIINEKESVTGALPDMDFAKTVLKVLGK
jgi:glutaredoxin-like protein